MPQTASEIITDFLLMSTEVILPVDTVFGRPGKFKQQRMLCIYNPEGEPELPRHSVSISHINRCVRIFLTGYLGDGLNYPAPKYVYPESKRLVADFVADKNQFQDLYLFNFRSLCKRTQ